MNKYILYLAFIVVVCGSSFSQNLEKIIEKHIEAHGGRANIEAVESIKITGDYTSFSETKALTEIKTKSGKYFLDYDWGQHPVIEAKNGDFYWTINPWFGSENARRTSKTEENIIDQRTDLITPFFNYKKKGYEVKLLGKEEVDGMKMFKLELTRPGQSAETWFINTKTYLEYMSQSMWGDFGSPAPQEAIFEDFRKVGEVVLPFYTERVFSIRHRVTEIQEIEINPEIDEVIFEMPKTPDMQRLNFLVGKWNVAINVLTRRGWTQADSVSTEISFIKNKNLIEENISYTNYYALDKITNISYNSESGKYRLCTFNDYYSNMTVLEGVFIEDTLVFDNTKISFSVEENPQKRFVQYKFSDISESGFTLNISNSGDKGESWSLRQKLIYSIRKD